MRSPHVLLNGLAGPTGGKTFDAQMVAMNTNDDEWIAAVGSYVRNAFGNHGALLTPEDVKALREQTERAQGPVDRGNPARRAAAGAFDSAWKMTASEHPRGGPRH